MFDLEEWVEAYKDEGGSEGGLRGDLTSSLIYLGQIGEFSAEKPIQEYIEDALKHYQASTVSTKQIAE
jgi:hypothetical protein